MSLLNLLLNYIWRQKTYFGARVAAAPISPPIALSWTILISPAGAGAFDLVGLIVWNDVSWFEQLIPRESFSFQTTANNTYPHIKWRLVFSNLVGWRCVNNHCWIHHRFFLTFQLSIHCYWFWWSNTLKNFSSTSSQIPSPSFLLFLHPPHNNKHSIDLAYILLLSSSSKY